MNDEQPMKFKLILSTDGKNTLIADMDTLDPEKIDGIIGIYEDKVLGTFKTKQEQNKAVYNPKPKSVAMRDEEPAWMIDEKKEYPVTVNVGTPPMCDKCKQPCNIVEGKYGSFWGCPNFRECGHKPVNIKKSD